MRDPGWPALMQYLQRLTYVMSMGRPAAQVALYIPSSSMWLGDAASDTAFVSSERMLAERQIDFDIINQDALATDLKADGLGRFETMSGNYYRVVILPSLAVISQAELDRLKAFSKCEAIPKCGGKVLFLGRTPALISQKTIMDSRAATPDDFAFATVETSAQLPPTPTPPANAPAAPPGPLVVPAAIETALDTVIGTREVALDTPDTALKVMTRRLKDAKVYLFFNEGAQASSHSVTLKTAGKTVEAWGPASGTVSARGFDCGEGRGDGEARPEAVRDGTADRTVEGCDDSRVVIPFVTQKTRQGGGALVCWFGKRGSGAEQSHRLFDCCPLFVPPLPFRGLDSARVKSPQRASSSGTPIRVPIHEHRQVVAPSRPTTLVWLAVSERFHGTRSREEGAR